MIAKLLRVNEDVVCENCNAVVFCDILFFVHTNPLYQGN